mmetsp:Transcript_10711/g.16797  ORF Transcript_10711/g.16797 Transcript_10711/m.16797 type:complete len:206 (-) Transcript_10711:120-737(-)
MIMVAVDEGANITCRDITYNGWTSLHHASFYGHAEVAERLIDLGANVNQVDDTRWTALHFAAFKGNTDVCSALLNCGADFMALTEKNKTALQKAVYMHHTDTIELLCEWMELPAEKFIGDEEFLDTDSIKQALDVDAEEEAEIFKAGMVEKDDQPMPGPEETEVPEGVVPEDRTAEEQKMVADMRAEYVRQYREIQNSQSNFRRD